MSLSATELGQQVEELLQFVYLMPVAVIKLDAAGSVQMLNPMAVQLLESLDVDTGASSGSAIMDALSPGLSRAWQASAGRVGAVSSPLRNSFHGADGQPLHLMLQVVRPDERCTMITIENVTATIEQERELQRSRQQLGSVLERIEGYYVAMLDAAGCLAEWNPSIDRMLGGPAGHLVGLPLAELLRPPHASIGVPPFSELRDTIARQGLFRREAALQPIDGGLFWGDIVITPTVDAQGTTLGYVVVIRDISEAHQTQQRLAQDAMTDPLTGLLNRRGLESAIAVAPATTSDGSPASAAWIMLDIDHFKRVNDTYGHEAGDTVLQQVAASMKAFARAGDLVARLGGEEFVVRLPAATLAVAVSAAERLRARIEDSELIVGGHRLRVTASLGVSTQAPGTAWSAAVQAADAALYRAKAAGRNRLVAADEVQAAA